MLQFSSNKAKGFLSRLIAKRITSPQPIPDLTWTKIEFNAVLFDRLQEFETATEHEYTAKASGGYTVKVNVGIDTPGLDKCIEAAVFKNGTDSGIGTTDRGIAVIPRNRVNFSGDIKLDKGDVLDVRIRHNAGVVCDVSIASTFAIHRFV